MANLLFHFATFILLFLCIDACPCFCTTQSPKNVDLCSGQAGRCKVVRCNPRSAGYACCDGRTTPFSPVTKQQARDGLQDILDNGEEAVRTEPVLSRRLARILLECRGDATKLANARLRTRPSVNDAGQRAYRRFATATEDTFIWIFNNLDRYF